MPTKLPKYCTEIKGNLYYQKAVPSALVSALKKATLKIPLGLKPNDPYVEIAARVAELADQYEKWFAVLKSDNKQLLSDQEREKAARAYLAAYGLSVGDLVEPDRLTQSQSGQFQMYVDSRASEAFPDLGSLGRKIDNHAELSEAEKVQELAWHMATEPRFAETKTHYFSDAWRLYAKNKELDGSTKPKRKAVQFWERFISLVGDQTLTTPNVYEAQRKFAEHRLVEGNQAESIARALMPVKAALRDYVEEHQLTDVAIKPYKIKRNHIKKERSTATVSDQLEAYHFAVSGIDGKGRRIEDCLRLALLLLVQAPVIPVELHRLTPNDLIVEGHKNYEGIAWLAIRQATKDSINRIRPIPLVVGVNLIKELAEKTSENNRLMGRYSSLTTDAVCANLSRVLSTLSSEASITSYCFRHGWLDRAYNERCSESFQDRVGGWSSGSKSKKRAYARLADTTIARLKEYEREQKKLNRELLIMQGEVAEVIQFPVVG